MLDVLPILQVRAQWRRLLNDTDVADKSIWKGLCCHYFPVLMQVRQAIEAPSVTWRQLFLNRAKDLKLQFRPQEEASSLDRFDYHFDGEVFQPRALSTYKNSFTIVTWNGQARLVQMQVTPKRHRNSMIGFELPADFLASSTSLDIYVQHSSDSAPCILYSGPIERQSGDLVFAPYNQFEKFHARSYFVGLCPVDRRPKMACIAIPSIRPYLENEGATSTLKLQFSWQVANDGGCMPMPQLDLVAFLEKGLSVVGNDFLLAENWAMTRFSSARPLTSYGFLVDYFLDTKEDLPCVRDITARFYEPTGLSRIDGDSCGLRFDVPSECQGIIPTVESDWYGQGIYMKVVVYVVDKTTGLQAKLYEGGHCGMNEDWDTGEQMFMMNENNVFENFAAISFFSARKSDSKNFGTAVATDAVLYFGSSPAVFQLGLMWEYLGNDNSSSNVPLEEDEFLTFLEKGLSWGRVASP
jgi:hypothetical protein